MLTFLTIVCFWKRGFGSTAHTWPQGRKNIAINNFHIFVAVQPPTCQVELGCSGVVLISKNIGQKLGTGFTETSGYLVLFTLSGEGVHKKCSFHGPLLLGLETDRKKYLLNI